MLRELPESMRPWADPVATVYVGSVAISRVLLGVHWPSDTVAALAWARLCNLAADRLSEDIGLRSVFGRSGSPGIAQPLDGVHVVEHACRSLE
jgi:hypothetical protein